MLAQGVFRGVLGAGEAICFGLDSIAVPYVKEAGVIFCFYATGVLVFIYMAAFHVTETKYFTEDDVVVPKHVVKEHAHDEAVHAHEKEGLELRAVEQQTVSPSEKIIMT